MRSVRSSIHLALTSLRAYGLRTFLTVLGIFVGVATVVAVLSIGSGVEQFVVGQLESFGGKTIFVEIRAPLKSGASESALAQGVQVTTLKTRDMETVELLPNVGKTYGVVVAQEKVTVGSKSLNVQVMGTGAAYPDIDDAKVRYGRFFSDRDIQRNARVVVIGSEVAERLFGAQNPVGKSLRMHGTSFQVIGVMEERGVVFFQNMDKMVFTPLSTAQKQLLGIDYLVYFVVEILDENRVDVTAEQIRDLLRKSHKIPPGDPDKDDFRVTTMEEAMETLSVVTLGVEVVLLAVACISLLVGGVGIMNIMYVSVIERTKEIGLKKSLGATNQAILFQFLFEAILITLFGGTLGVLAGAGISIVAAYVAASAGFGVPFIVTWQAIAIALGSALFFGVVFGYFPAKKAAKMHPVEALRFDG